MSNKPTSSTATDELLALAGLTYNDLIDKMGEGVGILDTAGIFVYCNTAMAHIVGISRHELIGRPLLSLIPTDSQDMVKQQLRRRRAGDNSPYECRVTRSDDSQRTVKVTPTPMRDSAGKVVGSFAVIADVSEQRQREKELRDLKESLEQQVQDRTRALRDSERRAHQVTDQFPFPVTITRLSDGIVRYANSAMADLMGVSPDEIIGQQSPNYWADPTDRLNLIRELGKHGNVRNFEAQMCRADGTKLTALASMDAFEYEGEQCLLGTAIDITAWRDAEQAQRETELRYQTLLDQAPDAVFVADLQGTFVEANPAAAKFTGYERAELIGSHILSVIPKRDHQEAGTTIGRIVAGEHSIVERQILRKDGQLVWGEVASTLVGGRYVTAIVRDLTERHAAAAALQASEHRLNEAERIAQLGSWTWTIATDELTWSDEVYRIFGAEPGSLAPTFATFMEAVNPADRQAVRDAMQDAIATDSVYEQEHRIVRVDGCERIVQEMGEIQHDDNGIIMIGTIQDITASRELSNELDKHRADLEVLVAERTRELREVQAELVRTERLAAIGHLLAVVSHELRNPLGTINNSVTAMKVRDTLGNEANAFDRISRSIGRCDRIIDELLHWARPPMLDLNNLELDAAMAQWLDDHELTEPFRIERQLASSAWVTADPHGLRRCVINLLTNAVQAATAAHADGDIQPQVGVRTCTADDRIEIHVWDNGHGLTADEIQEAFEPLRSTRAFGVGLGLPIVTSMMMRHSGGVDVQSNKGEATTFILWLPIT